MINSVVCRWRSALLWAGVLTLLLSSGMAALPTTVRAEGATGSAAAATLHTFILPVSADTEVNTHDRDKNYGGENEVKVLADSGGNHHHLPLFRYDLSSILPGSTIVTATVHFYVNNNDANPVNIHRVTVPWDEQTVTWNSFNRGYFATVEGAFTPAAENQFVSANITSLVQQWVTGVRPNRGLVLLHSVERKDSKYATKEQADLRKVSYLEVVVDNSAIHTFADDFAPAGSFTGSDGGDTWTTPWVELGESDGASAGDVLVAVDADCLNGGCLRIGNVNRSLTGVGVRRAVDLSPAVAASLSFRYHREDAHANMHVEVSRDNGATWRRLGSLDLNRNDSGYGYASYDISAYISASTQIRFIGEQTGGNTDKGVLIDDLRIAYLDSSALDSGIGDRVWDDLDRDYVQDVGEPGLANVAVGLYVGTCANVEPPAYRSTVTDDNGDYFFALLFAGQYCVVVDDASLPAGYAPTGDTSLLDVTLATSQIVTDADFGYASALANDRLTVGVYAPCTDIAWLQTLAAANSATAINLDYQACTFTFGGAPTNLDQLALDVAADNRERNVVADVWVGSAYTPNDPDFNNASLVYGPQQIKALAAWDVTKGNSNLIVAILDTGVDLTHPELAGRLLPGYDFVNEDADPTDDNGHGTHIAGIVAAAMDNALGMVGVAPQVKILPVKVLNANNVGWWSDISQGITWAVDQGAKVINLSLAGTADSTAMRDAISYATSRGALVVAAAGNNASTSLYYPASLEDVVAVGGSSYTGGWWSISNYGPNVDLVAPGALVWSLARGGGFQFMSGTSMATPHTAGVAALIYSLNPNLTPEQVKHILLNSAAPLGDPNNTGAGLVNAEAAVNSVQPSSFVPPTTSVETLLVKDLSANGIVDPGDTVRYNITVANSDTAPVSNVVVSSTVPGNTTYVLASTLINGIPTQDHTTGTAFPLDAGGLNIGTIPASNSTMVSFDVTVNPPVPVFNSLISRSVVDTGGVQSQVEVTTQVGGDACTLALKNDVGSTITTLSVGGQLFLSLTDPDENSRASTAQKVTVVVADALTGDQEHVLLTESGADTGVFAGSINLSSVLGAAADDGFLKTATGNQVSVSYADKDFSPDTCAGSLIMLAPGSADLRVTQSVDDSTPDEGQSILYTVRVRNNGGPALATSVVVSDVIPAGIDFISGSASHGDFDYDTGLWMVGRLPAGVEAVLTIDAEVTGESGDTIVNTARVLAVDQSDPVSGNESASTSLLINPADLQVSMSVNNSAPDENQAVRYTINVKNNGPAGLATNIVVSDVLPAGMAFVAAAPGQGSYDPTTSRWNVGTLALNANVNLLLDARYVGGFSGKPIVNKAEIVGFGQKDLVLSNNSATATLTPKTADLRVLISVSDTGPEESQVIAYTVKVKNQGPAALASNVVISDVLPAGLTYASATATQGSYSSATGRWTVGSLASNVEAVLTLNVTVNPGTSGQTLTNRAALYSFDQMDTVSSNNSAAVSLIVAPTDLRLTMSVNDTSPDEGQNIDYTVTVINDGPSFATGIVIRDLLPATLEFVSANPDVGSYNSATGLWSLNTTLLKTQSKKIVIRAKPKAGTSGQTLTNSATVHAVDQLDDDSTNNSASAAVTVNPVDIQVTVAVSDNTPDEGQIIDFTVTARNDGPSFATGIVIRDLLPAGLQFVSANPDVGTYDAGTGLWSLGTSLSSGQSKKVVIKAKPVPGTSGQSLTNAASLVDVDQLDTRANNDSASVSVSVNGVDIVVNVAVDENRPGENMQVRYTVSVGNDGPASVATGVVISSLLPAQLTFVSASPSVGTYNSTTHLWNLGSLNSGQTKDLVITAYVPNGLYDQTLTYQAQLRGVDQFETDDRDNARTKDITVDDTDIQVSLSVKSAVMSPGELAEFTVQVLHNGPAANTATNLVIKDLLPPGVAFVSANPDQGTYAAATGLWTVGSLSSGQSKKLTLKATVLPLDPALGAAITNQASFHSMDQVETTSGNNAASATVTLENADLQLTKTVNDADPDEGDVIDFTLEVRNYGPAKSAGLVRVQDQLPAGLSYVGATATQGSYDAASGIWSVGNLALWNSGSPSPVTLVIQARVDVGTNGTAITNTVASLYSQPDPVNTNDSAAASVRVQAPDLQITQSVSDATPDEHQPFVFTVKVKHNGPTAYPATGVVVKDLLAAGLTLIQATPDQGSYDPATGNWTVGSIAKGTTLELALTVKANPGTSGASLANTASLTAIDQREVDGTNNSASTTVTVNTTDLRVTKTVNQDLPDEGETIQYTVKVKNLGPSALAGGVQVRDLLPVGVTYVTSNPGLGTYNPTTGLWNVGNLTAVNQEVVLTIDATMNVGTSGTVITNTATLIAVDQVETDPANNSDSVPVGVQTSDLRVSVDVNDNTPDEFQTIAFTVKVRNAGPSPATGVVISNVVPAGMSFVSASATQGSYSSATGLWTVGSLGNGVEKALTLNLAPVAGTSNTTLTNRAAVHSLDQIDENLTNNAAALPVTVTTADLKVTKTVNRADPGENEVIVYTVKVQNDGPSAATAIVVRDLLPTGVSHLSNTPTQGSYDSVTGLWTVGNLADNASAQLTINARVGLNTRGQTITNTASIHARGQVDLDATNDTASVAIVPSAIDVRVQISVNDSTPDQGQIMAYTVKVKNNGPRGATGVAVSVPLPAGLGFVSATPGQGSYNQTTGLWTVGDLASGVEKALTLNAAPAAGTSGLTLTTTATLSALDQGDTDPTNNSASLAVTVNTADLRVSKVVNDPNPDEEQVIQYTINVRNYGPSVATNVVISDILPSGVTYKSRVADQGNYDRNTGRWTVGTLAAGANVNLVIGVQVNRNTSGQIIVNRAALLSFDQKDPNPANNSAAAEIDVQKTDIQITASVNDAAPDEFDTVIFTVQAKNLGPSSASGVVVADLLPAGLIYRSHVAEQGIYDRLTGLWVVGDLASGQAKNLTIHASVKGGTSGQSINNTATLRSVDQQDPQNNNNQSSTTISVRTADLRVQIAVDDTSPAEGQTIQYTVKVKNQGPSAATGIQVADVLPNGIAFVSAAPAQGAYDAATGLWSVGSLSSGVEKALVISAKVMTGTAASTIVNRAGVFAVDQADKVPSNDVAAISVTVSGADLGVAVSVNDATPAEGQSIRYDIVVTNLGPDDAANIKILDLLPAGVTYTGDNSGGSYAPVTGIWNIATLRKGSNISLRIDATVNAGTRDSVIVNQAEVFVSGQLDSLVDNNVDTAQIAVGDADLNVTVGVDDASPREGDPVRFTVRVTNQGPDSASGVKVQIPLPLGLRYVSHTASQGAFSPATGLWIVGDLDRPSVAAAGVNGPTAVTAPAYTEATLTLSAVVEPGTAAQPINLTASTANLDQADPGAGNNQGSTTLLVHGADVSLTKTVADAYPNVGDPVVYTLNLSNAGPDTATNLVVRDLLPDRVSFTSAVPSAGSYNPATGLWTLDSLAPSSTATLALNGVLQAGVESNILNIAELIAVDQPDGDSTPNNHAPSEDDQDEVRLFTGVPPTVDGKLDEVYSLSPDVERVCYTSNGVLFGVWHVLPRPTDNSLYVALVIDREFVDNTYGVNAVGWSGGHSFSQLVGSDHAQFIGYDANGVEVLDFKLDYIGSGFATPSGYASAGVISGDAGTVPAWGTSLAYNLNGLGYCAGGDCGAAGTDLLSNSPATDLFYTPNATYPDWIYEVIYEAEVDMAAFGPAGYGSIVVPYIHASPAKGSSNTIVAMPGICPGEIGDFVWHDENADGLQGDGEAGIDGISVSLYRDNGDTVFNKSTDTLMSTETTQAGGRYLFQDVLPGGYFVDVVNDSVPAGFSLRTANDPTALITLAAEQSYRDADFGYASLDFGDAPDPAYPTLAASNGARHVVDGRTFLGAGVDRDANGQSNPSASGDDQSDGNDDEDGVLFGSALRQGHWTLLTITASRAGRLNGWFDFDANGDWAGANEHPIADYPVVAGINQIYVLVPFDATPADTYARFRFSSQSGLGVTGLALDGEVEDYQVTIEAPIGGATSPGSIGDLVWHDQDGDGIQDPGEPVIPGVTVVLTNPLGVRTTLVSGASGGLGGNYTFENLPAGVYTVTLDPATVPVSYTLRTTPGQYVITLATGQTASSADFGLQALATAIGDFVWYDADADGVQDVGEPGLGNVTLDLYLDDGDGIFEPTPGLGADTLVDSTVTDIHGGYRLDAPVAGGYFVNVTDKNNLLAGLAATFGPQAVTDPSPLITVAQGDVHRDADFGYVRTPAPALIGDLVWLDGNGNGVYEDREPVLIGVQVCATPAGGGAALCATTDLNGRYRIDVPAGSYSVAPQANPFGLTPTTPVPYMVQVAAGEQVLDADFGFNTGGASLASLGGTVWQDLPVNDLTDGLYAAGSEPGIPNVSVDLIRDSNGNKLWDDGDPIVATLSRFGSGDYSFGPLLPGAYLVRVSDTLGVLRFFAPTVIGPNPGQDSNNQAQPYAITLAAGQSNTTGDFGYREYDAIGQGTPPDTGLIGDQVWLDLDQDGRFNLAAGDLPVPGVTLAVKRSGSATVLATATTGAYGQYAFTDLPLGAAYTVEVTDQFGVLTGYAPTRAGSNPGQEDNNQTQPYAVTLGFVARNTTADFGYMAVGTQFTLVKELITPTPARVGELLSFRIRITNTGSTVISVLPLDDSFDMDFLTYIGASTAPDSGPGAGPLGQLRWSDLTGALGELAPGQGVTLTVNFQARADTTLEAGSVTINTATVSGVVADPDGASGPAPRFPDPLPPQSDQANVGIVNPTAVTVVDGQVSQSEAGVVLAWRTVSEAEIAGFNLLRTDGTGEAVALTSELIPAQRAGQAEGANYGWVDETTPDGTGYVYVVEVVRLDGGVARFTLGSVRVGSVIFLPAVLR